MASRSGWRIAILLAIVILVVVVGCETVRRSSAPTPPPPPNATFESRPKPRVGDPALYPDSARTPGFTNPAITQDNIASNICNRAWSTSNVRPPASFTTNLKKQQMRDWSLSGTTGDYEEDHLISLEVGGNPRDPRNLWPEPWHTVVGSEDLGARAKDHVENYIHDEVCYDIPNHKVSSDKAHPATKSIPLARGQQILAGDWYSCYQNYQAHQPCE